MFQKLLSNSKYYLNTEVVDVEYQTDIFHIATSNKPIKQKLIVASGGLSYATLGASDIG